MKYVALIVFAVVTTAHLIASYKKDQTWRNRTKPFILISLLAYYLAAAGEVRISIVLALIFSWIGDVLLMPHGIKWFTAGGISFMIGHAFFIAGYWPDVDTAKLSTALIAALVLFFLVVVAFIFSMLKRFLPKALFFPMALYLFINGMMNCTAILRMLSNPCAATITTCIGAILFFISDSSLFFVRFNKDGKLKTHVLPMSTYSIGELLIVLGLV